MSSGGPRTPNGKAITRRNAFRHGVLSTLPVVPGLERPEDWQAHYAGILASLAPQGHMETVLAERVALQLWRLHRVARYEALSLVTAQEAAEHDVLERLRGGPDAGPPLAARLEAVEQQLAAQRERLRPIELFRLMGDEVPLTGPEAEAIVAAVEEITRPIHRAHVPLPFLAPNQAVDQYSDWTPGKLRQLLDIIGGRASRSPESILQQIIDRRETEVAKLERAAADLAARIEREQAEFAPMLQRERRERLLTPEPEMDKITRYEAHLSRELYRAMHELEVLQARRAGRHAPVNRLDVTIMPDTPKLRNEPAI
jgi:hypothetical protein